jgi:hypothetical protein
LDLSDPNKVTVGNYYQTENDIAQSVNGVYAALFGGSVLGTNTVFYEDCKAKLVIFPDVGVGGGENASFDNCTVKPSSTNVASRWNDTYKCIDRVNVVLKHLDDVTYSTKVARAQYEAEVRFARAYCYYALVTSFGEVPLVLSKLESLDAVNAANVRVSKDKVYEAIFADCKFAAESPLPNHQKGANVGRASKAAAYALWGKALLQMATDEDFASQKTALCADAKTALNAAWGMKTFSDFKTLPLDGSFDIATQADAAENIFQIPYLGVNGSSTSLNSMFRTSAIDDPAKETNAKKSAGSYIMYAATAERIWDEAGDKRFTEMMGHGNHLGIDAYYPLKYKDMSETGYYTCDLVVLRYADVALMLAEAEYHGGAASAALPWLNMVRNRAGLGDCTATSGTALRDAIYKERERELAFEFKGWSDLKRHYTKDELETFMKNVNNAAEYSDTDYYLPIPHAQYLLNPKGLWQNPGYQD